MRDPYPSETQARFMVRLPDGMRDEIAEAAKKLNRTMNAEIVSRLEASFALGVVSREGGFDVPLNGIAEKVEELEARLKLVERLLANQG